MLAAPSHAQNADTTFFVIGKHANFVQLDSGERQAVDYSFFSEIFLTADGNASAATLEMPTGERLIFRDMRDIDGSDRDNILLISGEDRFATLDELQSRYPDGRFAISFDTPSGDVRSAVHNFDNRGLPVAPMIAISQRGGQNCTRLQPGVDATVSWQAFEHGRADPNGILDDLVFVILTDKEGNRVSHSGRPFENQPYLTFAAEEYVIDGTALQPDSTYTLSVEHAILDDTILVDGVPAFTTRASTTKIEVTTYVDATSGKTCRASAPIPPLEAQVTMFYYKDIQAASDFYGTTLGLEQEFDWTWIQFYKTGPASSVGIIAEGHDAWHDSQTTNAVMLSLVTSDVDAWYERLRQRDVVFLKDIGNGGGIRSFLIADPGGYTVEFFEWLESGE